MTTMSKRTPPPRFRALVSLFLMLLCGQPVQAAESAAGAPAPPALELGALFSDNAILQRGIPLPVWGTALPGAKVTVSFREQTKVSTADKAGNWRVVLDPLVARRPNSANEAPEGAAMTIVSEGAGTTVTRTITNLVAGDVWLCAGQSNMAGRLGTNKGGRYPEGTIEEADYPGLRHVQASERGPWLVCTPATCSRFGKTAFFFGRGVHRQAGIPIGLVLAAVGGSNIESWLNQEPYARGGNYERLIAPMVGYGIRGVVWYQGESNTQDGLTYLPKLSSLIAGWRKVWTQPPSQGSGAPRGDFPVYIVQLPGCGSPPAEDAEPAGRSEWAETRQAQFAALAITNTGMVVTIDIGDASVHPPNKYDTGVRLSRLALNRDYGFKELAPTGPLYKGHTVDGSSVRIRFQYAESGLMVAEKTGILAPEPTPEKKLQWLAVKAKDGRWHWAEAKIDGSELVVSCPDVKEPVAARYAHVNRPAGCLLYSREGLPAAPFTTEPVVRP